jgi:hypothetical protein
MKVEKDNLELSENRIGNTNSINIPGLLLIIVSPLYKVFILLGTTPAFGLRVADPPRENLAVDNHTVRLE